MALHYILDGYNVIKSSEFPHKSKNPDPKISLINFLLYKKPCGSVRNKITVVYDGWGEPGLIKDGIEIIFSNNEEADERIRKLIKSSKNYKNIVVISDDGDLGRSVVLLGARIMKTKDFINKNIKKQDISKNNSKPELTFSEAYKITEELKNIWLKKGKG